MTHEILTLKAIAGDATVSTHDALVRLDEAGTSPADFTNPSTQALFVAMVAALREGRLLEPVSLSEAVGKRAPRALVLDVCTNWELGVSAPRLAALRDTSRKRALAHALRGLVGLVESGVTYEAAHNEALRVLQGLAEPASELQSSEGDLMELIDRLEAVQAGRRPPVLSSGIDVLDFVVGGLQPTLTVIGAMPGVGKSALLAALVRNLAGRKERVGLLSLEDSREWLTERLLADAAAVPLFVLGNKPLCQNQRARVEVASPEVHEGLRRVLIDDRHGMTVAEVVATARRMVAMGCRAVLVDHLGEIRLERSERHDLDIAEALQSLRGIAKTYAVPVVVAAHLRRRDGLNIDTEPKLTDFAFSSAVERMARVALGLWRTKNHQLGVAVLKQTRGPSGVSFLLETNHLAGVVRQTATPQSLYDEFKHWRDE